MIKLIATDMDGTFLRDDKTHDTKRFEAVAKQLRDKGIIGIIASGNSFDHIEKPFYLAEKDWLYFAGDNGNHIKYRQESIHINAIPRNIAEQLTEYVESFDGYYSLISTNKTAYVHQAATKQALHHFEKFNVEVIPIQSFFDIPVEEDIVKIAVMSVHDLATNKEMVKNLAATYPDITATTSGDMWIDIYEKNGGKGAALRRIKQQFNIDDSECIAFGDNLNDLSMMKEVLYSVAMQNADPDLTSQCQYQIGSNNDQAVIDVLEHIIQEDFSEFIEQYKQ